MTKKHYEAIAQKLTLATQVTKQPETVRYIAELLSNYFESDNPRFDRVRFLKACGIEQEAQECAICDTPLVGKRCPLGC